MLVSDNIEAATENFGTKFVESVVYGAQLDVTYTLTSDHDFDTESIKAELEGKVGVPSAGPLEIKFKAKFEKGKQSEKKSHQMRIDVKAIGVTICVPANLSFEEVTKIIDTFNKEYKAKFNGFDPTKKTALLNEIVPVGFMLGSTAHRVKSRLHKSNLTLLHKRMAQLGEVFHQTLFWMGKLESVNRELYLRYDNDPRLRKLMYDPYLKQQEKVIGSLEEKLNELLSFRAKPMSDLIMADVQIPTVYPQRGTKEEDAIRGLCGELYIANPVTISPYDPFEDLYYEGFGLKEGENFKPWMDGTLKDVKNSSIIAQENTPENLADAAKKALKPQAAKECLQAAKRGREEYEIALSEFGFRSDSHHGLFYDL